MMLFYKSYQMFTISGDLWHKMSQNAVEFECYLPDKDVNLMI